MLNNNKIHSVNNVIKSKKVVTEALCLSVRDTEPAQPEAEEAIQYQNMLSSKVYFIDG